MTTPDNGKFVDLYCNETYYGFANGSSVFYRHFLIDSISTLNITVTPIIGAPDLVISTSNGPAWPSSQPGDYQVLVQ